MIFSGNKIKFKRGDDDSIIIKLTNSLTGFAEDDHVYFSIRASAKDQVDIVQLEATSFEDVDLIPRAAAVIPIPSSATINLPCTTYYYDVYIKWADGTGVTAVGPDQFIVIPGGKDIG